MLEVKPANTCTTDCTDISPPVIRSRFTPSEQNFLTCLAYSMFLKDSMVLWRSVFNRCTALLINAQFYSKWSALKVLQLKARASDTQEKNSII